MTEKKTIQSKKNPATAKKNNPTTAGNAGDIYNEVKLDVHNPIPRETNGKAFTMIQGLPYSPFLSPDNTFSSTLLEARILSDTHNACITTKRDYCMGIGFQDKNSKPIDKKIEDWFKTMNRKNQNASDLREAAFESHFTFGNTPIEIVRFKVAGEKKLFVYVHNFLEWRLGPEDDDGYINEAVHSKLFVKQGLLTAAQLEQARTVPIYNPTLSDSENWKDNGRGGESTMIWFKNPVSGYDHYGLPSSIASLIYQILEYKGARYNLDEFENNMIVSALLVLAGSVSESEATKITRNIVKNHTGDGKRGRVVAVSSEDGINDANLLNLNTNKDGSYKDADGVWSQKIILANQWDAVLAGILSDSSIGKGSGFLTKILEHKLNTVIKPAQNKLMEKMWNPIFSIAQFWMNLPFDQFDLEIQNSIDISGLTDVDITPAVQVNEVRKAKGMPEDPAMKDVYMPSKLGQFDNASKGGNDVQN